MPIRLTPAVKGLMIACFAMFVIQHSADQFFGGNLLGWLALVPSGFILQYRFWQLFTYAFLHGDVMHLFLNLMMLAFIGSELETVWGKARFLRFYFICTSAAGVLYLLLQPLISGADGLYTPMVGASGGIYGLFMAYGLLFGERVMLFMLLFPMKAKHFIWILALVEFMSTTFSGRGGLSSVAHLGGMAAGFGYLWGRAAWLVAKKRRQANQEVGRRERRKRGGSHLRLVINKNEGKKSGGSDDADDGNPTTWH